MNKRIFVDRIEGDIAILMNSNGQRMEIAVKHLPKNLREGDWLDDQLSPDSEFTEAMSNAVRRVREKLTQGDDGNDFTL